LDEGVRIGRVFANIHPGDDAPAAFLVGSDYFKIPALEEGTAFSPSMIGVGVQYRTKVIKHIKKKAL
jgi:hypothetical protein